MLRSVFAAMMMSVALGSTSALAVETGFAGYSDTRIKTYVFDPAQVFRIVAHFGFVSTIQFAKGERVDSVQLGDHVSWQVDRLKRGDMLSVVPIENGGAYTNMLVTTNRRVYSFEMTARHAPYVEDPSLTYLYRFDYPMTAEEFAYSRSHASGIDDVVARSGEVGGDDLNSAYRASGPKRLKPIRMFDDGANRCCIGSLRVSGQHIDPAGWHARHPFRQSALHPARGRWRGLHLQRRAFG